LIAKKRPQNVRPKNNLRNSDRKSTAIQPDKMSAICPPATPAVRSALSPTRRAGQEILPEQDGIARAFKRLSEHWHRGEQVIDSATIITTDANEMMEGIHDRMPVILSPENYDLWLEPDFHGQGKLLEMLRPYPAEEMTAYPVSTVVNNPRNETEKCVEAVG
jgi:hypothetical protein